jgi:A/G-specific adenine glycosylase
MVHFQRELINWYQENKRDLPWRKTSDPYKVWLSEVILQQTRVVQGRAYYEKFVSSYPTVNHLASATEEQVLNLWKGLGYYSRARNLHKTAIQVVSGFGGVFPKNYEGLLTLTGIGPYTAAAISSFCFDEPRAVLDGNVFRVLSRLHNIATPINTTSGFKEFSGLAAALLKSKDPATYNQAIMEFGALQCTPKAPKCEICCFNVECLSLKEGVVKERPKKLKKTKTKTRFLLFTVLYDNEHKTVFLRKRTEKDIWQNFYDFKLTEFLDEDSFLLAQKKRTCYNKIHKLTHQTLQVCFIKEDVRKSKVDLSDFRPYNLSQIENIPLSALHQKYIDDNLGFLN